MATFFFFWKISNDEFYSKSQSMYDRNKNTKPNRPVEIYGKYTKENIE